MPASPVKLPVPPLPTLSVEVKNILDAPPSWLIRWGSLLLLAGIVLLLLAAGFVRYPSLVTGQAVLYGSGERVAIALPARAADYTLRVQPRQQVAAGQLLAIVRQGPAERALAAPLAGTVLMPPATQGRTVLELIPTAQARRSVVTVAGAQGHRLRVGQRVLISLSDFPSEKFGQLLGHVVTAPEPVAGDRTRVAITLDQGYLSTHGVVLPVAGDSHGTAQIITTDKRVLERLLRL